jgi:O-antigen ligase
MVRPERRPAETGGHLRVVSVARLPLRPDTLIVPLALTATSLAAWQAVGTPGLVVAGVAALMYAVITLSNLLAGVAIFTVLTFPESLPDFASASTVAKPAGIVLGFSWVLLTLSRRGDVPLLARDEPVLALVAGAFLVWAAASTLWAMNPEVALSYLSRLVQVVVLFAIVYTAAGSARGLRVFVWALLLAVFGTVVYGLATSSYHNDRLHGIFDANYLAAHLVACIALSGFMIAASPRVGVRLLLAVMFVTYGVAFLLTQSRGGLVAFGVALVAAIALAGRFRPHLIVVALLLVATAVGYYGLIAATEVRQRVTDFSAEGSAGRTDHVSISLEMIRDHPLGGVGIGNYPEVETRYVAQDIDVLIPEYVLERKLEAHNTYLQTASELGIPGLVLYLALAVLTIAVGLGAVRRFESRGDFTSAYLARGMIVAAVGLFASYVFFSGLVEKPLWMILGALAAMRLVARGTETPPNGESSDGLSPVAT